MIIVNDSFVGSCKHNSCAFSTLIAFVLIVCIGLVMCNIALTFSNDLKFPRLIICIIVAGVHYHAFNVADY